MSLLGKDATMLSTEESPYLIAPKQLSRAVGHIICQAKDSNCLVAH